MRTRTGADGDKGAMPMLLRKLVVAVCPLLMCLLTALLFKWLDGMLASGNFFLYALKGVILGVCVALLLPVAGMAAKNTGLTGYLLIAAGLLLLSLLYQYLETVGALHWPALLAIITVNGQVVLIESTVMGYLTLTALLNPKRPR